MTCTKLADPYPNPILVQIEPMQCKSPIKISWICSCEKSSETGFFLLLLLFPLPDVASDSRAGGSCCPHPPKDIESNTPTLKIAPVPSCKNVKIVQNNHIICDNGVSCWCRLKSLKQLLGSYRIDARRKIPESGGN